MLCEQCGGPILWNSQRYCSRSCVAKARWEGRPARPTKSCRACGATFEKHPKYSHAQWERAEFCSNKCRGKTIRRPSSPVSVARPLPLCECGCGEAVRKRGSRWRKGHAPRTDRIKSLQVSRTSGKTRWWTTSRTGKRIPWAHVVMQDRLGRPLLPGEVVHHINGDSADDRPENLEVFASHAEHMRHEWREGNLRRAREGGSYKAR